MTTKEMTSKLNELELTLNNVELTLDNVQRQKAETLEKIKKLKAQITERKNNPADIQEEFLQLICSEFKVNETDDRVNRIIDEFNEITTPFLEKEQAKKVIQVFDGCGYFIKCPCCSAKLYDTSEDISDLNKVYNNRCVVCFQKIIWSW